MKRAVDFLKRDETMRRIIEEKGKVKLRKSRDYFGSLVSSIMYQQLNAKAAKSIYNRFLSLFPNRKLCPEFLVTLKEQDLIEAGVSRQKRRYLRSLAEKFLDKTIIPERFHKMSDEEIINELTRVKGIGKWSAQMFLMFSLAREDVFASDDFGLRKAIQVNYNLEKMPKPEEAAKFAKRWKPYRSYASLYLWRSLK